MTQISRTALAADISNNIYTNTQRRIKGNTVRDRMLNVIDSSLNIIDDANVPGGYLAIDTNGLVDVSFIKKATPTGQFLRDDGTWQNGGGGGSQSLQDVTDIDNATTNAIYLNRPDGQPALVVVHSGLDCIDMGVRSGGGGYIHLKDDADNATIVMRGTDGGFMQIGGYDVVTANVLTAYQATSEKGANNGYASLDSGGKVPASQLPSTLMTLMGSWNASTNTPTLANGVGDVGDVYECTVAGSVDFGAGAISFKVGDWAVCGAGSVWYKSLNSNEVTSVNGQTGTVVLSTTHISEGTNLYWTSGRFDTAFAAKSTSDLSEGTNQYFTDARARTAVISQVITNGVTDRAPSEDAVFDALALKRDHATVLFIFAAISPADATTYYGGSGLAPSTTAANQSFRLPYSGIVKGATIIVRGNTTSGSAENNTMNFRNVTQATSTLISNAFTTKASATALTKTTVEGLNISFASTDDICMEWVAPTWATNPQAMTVSIYLDIEKT